MTGFERRGAALTLGITAMALILAGSLNVSAQATSWDAAIDFSASANPTGAWSYGWSIGRGSAFNLSTVAGMAGGLHTRRDSSSQPHPGAFYKNPPYPGAPFCNSPTPPRSPPLPPGPNRHNTHL